MNYFAHGYRYIDRPWFLAGTALPDWLNVVDRRVRVRKDQASRFMIDSDFQMAELASGIVQHHHDDHWFHSTAVFTQLSLSLTQEIRCLLSADTSWRPSFLGHIAIELLLDAALISRDPSRLDAYYSAIGRIDAEQFETAVNRIARQPVTGLADWIGIFLNERFLYDYTEDEKLYKRLNQVMRRVGLSQIPAEFNHLLPAARSRVVERMEDMLACPAEPN